MLLLYLRANFHVQATRGFYGIGLLIRVGGEVTKVRSPHDELTGQSNTISNL